MAGTTVRSRRLALKLRELRLAAGLRQPEVAAYAGHTTPWVSQIENPAKCRPSVGDVRTLLTLYGHADNIALIGQMVALAREVREPGWWHPYDLSETLATFVALETDASAELVWDPQTVPGLLQTADYARAVISAGPHELPQARVDELVRVRAERKKALHRPAPLQLHVIAAEAVLWRPCGGRDVMAGQLRHLIEAAEAPNVTFQVMPYAAGAHPGLGGSFTILQYPDPADHDVVYCETPAGALYAEKPGSVARQHRVFSILEKLSLSQRASIDLAAKAAADL